MQIINYLTHQSPVALRFQSAPIFSVQELTNAFVDLRSSGQRLISLEEISAILDKVIEGETIENEQW